MQRAKPWVVGLTVLISACAGEPVSVPATLSPAVTASAARHVVSDAHFHYVDFLQHTDGIERVIQAMDEAGVEHTMISGMALVKKWNAADPIKPGYYLDDDSRTYWYSVTDVIVARAVMGLAPEQRRRFHPFIAGINGTDKNAVEHVQRMLDLYPGLWHGIGELFGHHDDLTALTYGEAPRANHPALDPVFRLAAERDLPVSIHSNITSVWKRAPIWLGEIEDMLGRHPKTRFIWCHAGISRRVDVADMPGILGRLLGARDNLWIDLSWVVYDDYVAPEGVPDPAWLALVEAFPTRFMIGSDSVGSMDEHAATIRRYYPFLDALSPEVARRVARDNFLGVLPLHVRHNLIQH